MHHDRHIDKECSLDVSRHDVLLFEDGYESNGKGGKMYGTEEIIHIRKEGFVASGRRCACYEVKNQICEENSRSCEIRPFFV